MMQQHAHLRMLAYDRSPIGGRVRDLACRGYRMHVGYLVGDGTEQRHQEHRNRAGRDQRRRGVALHGADLHRQRCDGDDDRQRRRAIQGYRDAVMRRHRIVAFVGRHGDVYRHRTNQHEHDDECYEQGGSAGYGIRVDCGA